MPTLWVDVHDDDRTVEMVLADPAKALRDLLALADEFDLGVEVPGEHVGDERRSPFEELATEVELNAAVSWSSMGMPTTLILKFHEAGMLPITIPCRVVPMLTAEERRMLEGK